jgi:dihydrofolate synthase/folylpolyglutamate synthase
MGDYFSCQRAFFVVGTSADKDVDGLAEELAPIAARVIATRSRHPRAMPPQQIAAAFARLGVEAATAATAEEALARAVAEGGEQEVICLAGSLFLVAEGREPILGATAQR